MTIYSAQLATFDGNVTTAGTVFWTTPNDGNTYVLREIDANLSWEVYPTVAPAVGQSYIQQVQFAQSTPTPVSVTLLTSGPRFANFALQQWTGRLVMPPASALRVIAYSPPGDTAMAAQIVVSGYKLSP